MILHRFSNICNQMLRPALSDFLLAWLNTGFTLEKGESKTILITPSSWDGRFWARTHCAEDSTGKFTSLTGDCGSGKPACSGLASVPGATIAEFSLNNPSTGSDIYDISLVDGFNLPLMVLPQGGRNCSSAGCTMDLNSVCPKEFKTMSPDGEPVACKSACAALGDPQYCCTGNYSDPQKCQPTSYSKLFKSACPTAYSYTFDDSGSTFTCSGADYQIVWCPTLNDTRKSGGVCGNGTDSGTDPKCLYKPGNNTQAPGPGNNTTVPGPGKTKGLGLKIGIAGGVAVSILFVLLLLFIFYRQKKTRHNSSSYPKDVEAFIRKYGSSVPKRLKVLNATKGNGEEFMNEVASIGRTSHVNVVSLLGFVYEDKRRALIYEFMPNGSLEKFIHGTTPSLSWQKLYRIALGIARGLEYLHCGCTTQILHFDIKPHNILLDEDFGPKISDFGLAKLYTRKGSVSSSIMQARGTMGYIAPEVISRTVGQVSHKSDVYSYGMMILEMAGGRKNVDTSVARTSEIYSPDGLNYKHIHDNNETSRADNISQEENHIARKMMIVGLWCIQTNPSQRPSISKVIEMLEGNLAALEIPPRPYMCSPLNSLPNSQQKNLSRSSSLRESDSSLEGVSRSN